MNRPQLSASVRRSFGAVHKHGGRENRQPHHPKKSANRGAPHGGRPGERRKQTQGETNMPKSTNSGSQIARESSRQWCMEWPSADVKPSAEEVGTLPNTGSLQKLTLLMRHTETLDDLLNVIIRDGDSFNHVHTTAALQYLQAKLFKTHWNDSARNRPLRQELVTGHGSPLLGGAHMCMYIGDASEEALPKHGPVTWDIHVQPAERTPSMKELYSFQKISEGARSVVHFPPVGSYPELSPVGASVKARNVQPKPSRPEQAALSRPQVPSPPVVARGPPRSRFNGNGARDGDTLTSITPCIERDGKQASEPVETGSTASDQRQSDSTNAAESVEREETTRKASAEDEAKVLECLRGVNDFAEQIAENLGSADNNRTSRHPAVLPRSMHIMQFLGPNRGVGHVAEQVLLANGLVRDTQGRVVHEPHACISGQHPRPHDNGDQSVSQSKERGEGEAATQSSSSTAAQQGEEVVSERNVHMKTRSSEDTSSKNIPAVHVSRRGGLHIRRNQLLKEVGGEPKGVLIGDKWLLPGFTKVPQVPKEVWPKLLYALDIICRKLYAEIEGPIGARKSVTRASLIDRHESPLPMDPDGAGQPMIAMNQRSASMIAWAISMHWLYMRGSTYSIARQVIIALRNAVPTLAPQMDAQSVANISLALMTTSHANVFAIVKLSERARQVLDKFTFSELGMWLSAVSPFLSCSPQLQEVMLDAEQVAAKQILKVDFSRERGAVQGVASLMWVATSASGGASALWFPQSQPLLGSTTDDDQDASDTQNQSQKEPWAGHILTADDIDYDSDSEVPHGGGAIINAALERVPELASIIGPAESKSASRMMWCMASHLYYNSQLTHVLVQSILDGIRANRGIKRWEPSAWLWAIGRLNVPLTPKDRATILSFCKQYYPSGNNISVKVVTHTRVMDSSLRRKLALELRAAAEMHELRAAADAERKYALDERVHTMLVFAEVNNFLNRDSFSKDTSTRSSVSSPEYSAAYTPDGASRYSRFAADRDLTSNRNSDSRGSELENGQGSLSPASASTESPGALLKWLRTDSILPRSIRQQAIDGTLAKVRSTAQKPPSRFQLEVFNILQAMGTKPVNEYVTADGLFAIDIALWARGATRIAVEVDGPSHFAVNDMQHITGKTKARRKALSRLGWVVLSVPVAVWLQLKDRTSKERWLRDQLLQATRSGAASLSAGQHAQRTQSSQPQSTQPSRTPRYARNHTPQQRPAYSSVSSDSEQSSDDSRSAQDVKEWMPNRKAKGQWLGGPHGTSKQRHPRRVRGPKDAEALLANGRPKARPKARPKGVLKFPNPPTMVPPQAPRTPPNQKRPQ